MRTDKLQICSLAIGEIMTYATYKYKFQGKLVGTPTLGSLPDLHGLDRIIDIFNNK